jgi:hypothetical protein
VARAKHGVEAIHVRVDDWDYFTSPSTYANSEAQPAELPTRPFGVGAFGIGAPPAAEDAHHGAVSSPL